tara:strand:+ start:1076 stop:1210 length:135 start_codon:yes stop_codon:yes gene_type:complete
MTRIPMGGADFCLGMAVAQPAAGPNRNINGRQDIIAAVWGASAA